MKLGIGTYTFMWSIGFPGAEPVQPMNAFDLLGKAREFGVRLVQYGPNLSLANLGAEELSSFVDSAQKWGISIEIGTQGLETKNLREQLSLAKRAGCRLLRTTTEGANGLTVPVDEMRERILAVVPDLEEQDVFLAIENGRVAAATLAELVRSARSAHVGITLDTVNSLAISEGTQYVIETLSPHVRSLHVKDFAVERLWHRMGFSVQGRAAGRGQLDVPELLQTLGQVNPEANAILELWPPEQATLEDTIRLENSWVEESISYLRRYIAE